MQTPPMPTVPGPTIYQTSKEPRFEERKQSSLNQNYVYLKTILCRFPTTESGTNSSQLIISSLKTQRTPLKPTKPPKNRKKSGKNQEKMHSIQGWSSRNHTEFSQKTTPQTQKPHGLHPGR
ncbi:hypothetical protein KC19_9G062000 [Ceratodon purpureus]|uniref:Uncharacterized protein n=1 Tax=Ceratodon purpureus TaxID=3225 RepID=A0A8T0GUP2_CERPU|nr:hypothetical protein KC19_9G062000 [Ceratodon purpureus]